MSSQPRYTLAQTNSSLIAAAIICSIFSVTYFVGIKWIRSADVGLADGESAGAFSAAFGAVGFFFDASLALLAILVGSIATYRGAIKARLSGAASIPLVLISIAPPVAVIVHAGLFLRLRGMKAAFATEARPAVAAPKWPLAAAGLGFVVAVAAQVLLAKAGREAGMVRAEIATITSPAAVRAMMDGAIGDRLYFGQDFEGAVMSRAQEIGRRRQEAEGRLAGILRSANVSIWVSNISTLVAIGFLFIGAVVSYRVRKLSLVGLAALSVPAARPEAGVGAGPQREFFLMRNGQRCGPYSESVLRSLAMSSALTEQDVCWTEGWEEWRPVAMAFQREHA